MFEKALNLYKFYSLNWTVNKEKRWVNYTLDSLANKYIYMSNFDSLNDAFERKSKLVCRFARDEKDLSEKKEMLASFFVRRGYRKNEFQIKEAIDKINNEGFEEFNESIKAMVTVFSQMFDRLPGKDISVSCFTRKNNEALMWAHYANGMRGVCIEYFFNNDGNLDNYVFDVNYENDKCELDFWSYIRGDVKEVVELHRRKSRIWSYEEEVRVISPHKDSHFNFCDSEVKSIIFGCKTSVDDAAAVLDIINKWESKPEIKFAEPSRDSYQVEISSIENQEVLFNRLKRAEERNLPIFDVEFK